MQCNPHADGLMHRRVREAPRSKWLGAICGIN